MTAALISTAFALVMGLALGFAVLTLYDSLATIIALVSDHTAGL